jgi:hypothetical protein
MAMDDERFARAVAAFTRVSTEDPAREMVGGVERPREQVWSERLVSWVERLEPNASEALRLAAHAQHVGRYRVPRASYPEGRSGYLRWRAELSRKHAAEAARILTDAGYDATMLDAVQPIVLKQNLRDNADAQTMEDALCLAFLAHELGEFAERHPEDKLISILRKTWRKMSPRAQALALELPLTEPQRALVAKALAPRGPAA